MNVCQKTLSYNVEKKYIEGFEDFGSQGRTQYVPNHVIVFMVRGVVVQLETPFGVFPLH